MKRHIGTVGNVRLSRRNLKESMMTRKGDERLTQERKKMVNDVTEAEMREIDEKILENASLQWSKVSRIVLTTMIEREEGVTGLPESFYSERVAKLAKEGLLESRGDLSDMHSCEVRLAKKI